MIEFNLSPVQKIGDFLFKRDDLFMPFKDIPVNGGKVRQCISLFNEAHDHIVNDCGSTVLCGVSMNSPQGLIVTRTALEFGFRSIVFVGHTKIELILDNPERYPMMTSILNLGGEINADSPHDYSTVLESTIRKYCESHSIHPFIVKFGINFADYRNSIVESVASQVQNIPDVDNLIVPCGSGIMLAGILTGLKKYGKKVGRVIGIQIDNHDVSSQIESILNDNEHLPYELILSNDFKYNRKVKESHCGLDFDWVYEGKAWNYMKNHMPDLYGGKMGSVLFWCVGNSTLTRTNIYNK